MPLCFEKPPGSKDLLPEKLQKLQKIIASSKELIEKWGYEEVESPLIEYHKTVGLNSKIDDEKLIKFLDGAGKTVILRPDFTTPMARFIASGYKDIELPIRLMYQGYVFRNKGYQGFEAINQLGIELVGVDNLEADAEVITLAIKIISTALNSQFKVAISHSSFFKILLKQLECSEETLQVLYTYLLKHDYVSFQNAVNELEISPDHKKIICKVIRLRGDYPTIIEAQDWFQAEEWQNIFREISGIWNILCQYGLENYIIFDLSRVGRQNYYTGLIYNIYCEGHPEPICSGGRYNQLLASFGRKAAATGFAINIDDLANIMSSDLICSNTREKILIIYSPANRSQAFQMAEDLRNKGKIVSLVLAGTASKKYQEKYSEVITIN